jgi:hypothetical protein
MPQPPTDPVEALVHRALTDAGIEFTTNSNLGLDFYLPAHCIYIECKRFPSDRVLRQLSSAPHVILIQGLYAARAFYSLLNPTKEPL